MDKDILEEKNTEEAEKECCSHEHKHDHEHEHHHHHHHDDEECGCDHEHEHHHHHHDDEECGCDHDHEHEHHHHHDDDECGCDHDHEHEHHHHDHGHQYEIPGFKIFETHNHEGATICSFEKDVNKDINETVKNMESGIKELEEWLNGQDALIGHLKGYVKESGPITTFSTVGYGLNIEKHENNSLYAGFASIVFGPGEEELKDKVAEIFTKI